MQFGGQARVAWIAPIGVPMRLMLYLQTQPKSLPSAKAIGGIDLQGGLNLGVADHLALGFVGRIDIGASQYLGLRLNRTQ